MRIVIDLTPDVQGHAGMGRYAGELARALLTSALPDERLEIFYNDPLRRQPAPPLDALPRKVLWLSNKLWRMSVLVAQLARIPQDRICHGADLFHATDHLLPYLSHARSVFTLHDLAFRFYPETHTRLNRWFLTLMMPRFLRAADAIIAVSECTKQDALRLYGIDRAKIMVIGEGVHPRFRSVGPQITSDVRRKYGLPEHFILAVGTIEPRKNLPILFEAFKQAQRPEVKLVIAGKKGWLYDRTFARLRELGLGQRVAFTDFVPDEDLPALYTAAEAFAFPSLYEGFGLPVLEAMACGTPVLCSNTSSLPEVAGDAALPISPGDVRGWAQAIEQITRDATLRAELRQRGLRQAKRFSWEETARQTREVYREIYAHRP